MSNLHLAEVASVVFKRRIKTQTLATGQVRSDKGEITRWQKIFPKLSVLTVPSTMRVGR